MDINFDDEVKYKKKSDKKYLNRADHKHQYIDAIIACSTDKRKIYHRIKVCSACGYVGKTVKDWKIFLDDLNKSEEYFLNLGLPLYKYTDETEKFAEKIEE